MKSALAAAIFQALSTAALAGIMQTYTNERFGTTAEVPASWTAGTPPENGDGLFFTSPDGKATIAIAGALQTADSVAEELDIYAEPLPGETIAYQHREASFLVVSGFRGEMIFYRKTILTCSNEVLNTVSIEYPAARKKEFDGLVKTVADSLHGGVGWQNDNCGPGGSADPAPSENKK